MKKNSAFLIAVILLLAACNSGNREDVIEESGTIESTNIILSSQSSGQIEKIFFDEGDLVKSGDTIFIVEHEILDIKLIQAEAQEKAARARLDLAVTGAREEDIALANEQLVQAESNFEVANNDLLRMKKLYDEQVITKKQFEEIESKYIISKSRLNAAKENLMKVQNISRPEEIIQIRSNHENAKAQVDLIKKQIKDTHILSPINGFIVEKYMEIGELVNKGAAMVKLSDLSRMELTVFVNEENLGKVKLGQIAEVMTDSYKDKSYEGKVIYISPEAEFTPKNIQTKDERTKLVFAVKIEILNPDFELKSGMPADARINI
ncbi:MAG: efflux RND transporter periplasmic adaptor subunit [Melioribacteraceae bacterium]|nr:efflux RND transporter periplasmic adaptor subunit [Melioribacteraceae bacterium]